MKINLANWSISDYARLVASALVAFAAGAAHGDIIGGVITAVAVLAGTLQTPPGHYVIPR